MHVGPKKKRKRKRNKISFAAGLFAVFAEQREVE
jgi:hypothetical protein